MIPFQMRGFVLLLASPGHISHGGGNCGLFNMSRDPTLRAIDEVFQDAVNNLCRILLLCRPCQRPGRDYNAPRRGLRSVGGVYQQICKCVTVSPDDMT
jgi:hypothetical protein